MLDNLSKNTNLNAKFAIMSGIECAIERKKRKSLAVHIINGEVIIKAPLKLDIKQIEIFIQKKRNWIINKIDTYFIKYHKFLKFSEHKEFILHGNIVPHFFADIKKIAYDGHRLLLPNKCNVELTENYEFKRALKRFYLNYAKSYLADVLQSLASQLGIAYDGFSLTSAKTKWGSCDSKKHIKLNWRLVFLPENLQKYVVIHELCHTYYLNHSKNYWNLLIGYIPAARQLRKQLKDFSPVMSYLT